MNKRKKNVAGPFRTSNEPPKVKWTLADDRNPRFNLWLETTVYGHSFYSCFHKNIDPNVDHPYGLSWSVFKQNCSDAQQRRFHPELEYILDGDMNYDDEYFEDGDMNYDDEYFEDGDDDNEYFEEGDMNYDDEYFEDGDDDNEYFEEGDDDNEYFEEGDNAYGCDY